MASHNELGKKGEELAVAHLKKNGYQIITRNWYYDRAELDIVARIGDELVIVEVKTRASDEFGDPRSFLTTAQQRQIIRAADAFVQQSDFDLEVRFDVIAIILDRHNRTLEHIEDAFQPQW